MIKLSPKHALLAGLGLILGINAIVLLGVAYNRSGEPESILQLSQRELQTPYASYRMKENSGLSLGLKWRVLGKEDLTKGINAWSESDRIPAWFDASRLKELGFEADTAAPGHDRNPRDRQLPKQVYLVLEMDGPAYQAALARARQRALKAQAAFAATNFDQDKESIVKSAREALKREEQESSRLFVVDAGLDVQALRGKYVDRSRYAIVKGTVRPQTWRSHADSVTGQIGEILTDQVNVPIDIRKYFSTPTATGAGEPPRAQHDIRLAFGNRLEPWILAATGKK